MAAKKIQPEIQGPADRRQYFEIGPMLQAAAESAKGGIFTIPKPLLAPFSTEIENINVSRWQPRRVWADAELNELGESLTLHGQLSPCLVVVNEAGAFELVAGERRYRAAKLLGWSWIRVQIIAGKAEEIHEIAIVDNTQRRDLNPLEEGEAYQRLASERGMNNDQIAKRVGKSKAHVQQRRALAGSHPAVGIALQNGQITAACARGVISGSGGDPEVQSWAVADCKITTTEEDAKKIARTKRRKFIIERLNDLGWKFVDVGGVRWCYGGDADPFDSADTEKLIRLLESGSKPSGALPERREWSEETIRLLRRDHWTIFRSAEFPYVVLYTHRTGTTLFRPDEEEQAVEVVRSKVRTLETYGTIHYTASWIYVISGDRYICGSSFSFALEKVEISSEWGEIPTCAKCGERVDPWIQSYGPGRLTYHEQCRPPAAPPAAPPAYDFEFLDRLNEREIDVLGAALNLEVDEMLIDDIRFRVRAILAETSQFRTKK